MSELRRTDITIKKIGIEWCAFHPNGTELARSEEKEVLFDWLKDALGENPAPVRGGRVRRGTKLALE